VCDTRAVFGNNQGVTPEGVALCISQHSNYSEVIFGIHEFVKAYSVRWIHLYILLLMQALLFLSSVVIVLGETI